MKRLAFLTLNCWAVSAWATTQPKSSADAAIAEQSPVETFQQGCKTELDTYCKDITPGEGRILACIYAHGDKNALCDSEVQLELAGKE